MNRAGPLIAWMLLPALASAESLAPDVWVLEGVVREVSGGPVGKARAILRTAKGEKYELRARSPVTANELLRLARITIRARGTELDLDRRIAMVESYEIVALPGGQRPVIGRLALQDTPGGPRLMFVDPSGKALCMLQKKLLSQRQRACPMKLPWPQRRIWRMALKM